MVLPKKASLLWIRFVAILYLLLGPAIALFGVYAFFSLEETALRLYGAWPVNRIFYGVYHLGYGLFLLAVSIAFFKRYRPLWIIFLVLSLPEHFTWFLSTPLPWSIIIVLIELGAWTMTFLSADLFRK